MGWGAIFLGVIVREPRKSEWNYLAIHSLYVLLQKDTSDRSFREKA